MFINFFHYSEHIGVPRKLSVCVLCIRTGRGGTKLATTFYPLPPLPSPRYKVEQREETCQSSKDFREENSLSSIFPTSKPSRHLLSTLFEFQSWTSRFFSFFFFFFFFFFFHSLAFLSRPVSFASAPILSPRYVFNEAGIISTTDLLQTRVSLTRFPFVYSVIVRFLYIHEYE